MACELRWTDVAIELRNGRDYPSVASRRSFNGDNDNSARQQHIRLRDEGARASRSRTERLSPRSSSYSPSPYE
jgi:hypothetical protein